MPSRNVIKEYVPDSYYHVYARGASKQKIFFDAADYNYFLGLFARYLSNNQTFSKTGEPYPHFRNDIKLHAYCLMSNHFHILIHQEDAQHIQRFMKSIMTSYSRYSNLKYRHTGSLFESRYKAVRIDTDQHLEHMTRYIHLNPRKWEHYSYSSLKFFRDGNEPEWLDTEQPLSTFANRLAYMEFVSDYEAMKDSLSEIKNQLVDQ